MKNKFTPTKFMLSTSHYDEQRALRVIKFIENLRHTKAEWYNKPFVLLDWQLDIIKNIFGVIKEDGYRQFTTAYIEIAKKQGKTEGDITIWINSPGGDCVAASQIYNMLMNYKGNVTVKIDGIAASAASVVAMAGTKVLMSPTALLMLHNPFTVAIGDSEEMKKAISMLGEVKESIINAYEIKTSLPRAKISKLMDAETWLNANKALELGLADDIMFKDKSSDKKTAVENSFTFSRRAVTNSLLDKIKPKNQLTGTPIENLDKRLSLLK